jgi:hypothetical protein
VERGQRAGACLQVGETAQQHEAVLVVQIPELAEDMGLNQLAVEQLDQLVTPAGVEGVLPQLENLSHRRSLMR